MEILRSDFEEKLDFLKDALVEADFISIDTEFTGLTTPNVQFQLTDDLELRYNKLKSCIQEFSIIQYGVCAFKKVGDHYVAKPFNFYIFGSDTESIQTRRMFTATTSSLRFLRENKFDFNKLIQEGIPFYNYSEENSMFQSNHGRNVPTRNNKIKEASLNVAAKKFLEFNRKAINKWLQGQTEKPLVVQVNSSFYKKLIYQEVQEDKYNGFLNVTTRDTKHLYIHRLKPEEKRQKSVNSPKLNFRRVIELIKKANCPIVAHNAVFDLLHTVDQFWQYLPSDMSDFKEVFNSMWPTVVDTKYLAEYHPALKDSYCTSALGSLYNSVHDELKSMGQTIVMADGFDRYNEGEEMAHEAGYDAYMTGVIYLGFITLIHKRQTESKLIESNKRKHEEDNKEEISNKKIKLDTKEGEATEEVEASEEGEASEETKESTSSSESESSSDSSSSSDSDSDSDSDSGSDSDSEKLCKKKKSSFFMDKSIIPYYGRIFLMRSEIPYIDLKGNEIKKEVESV